MVNNIPVNGWPQLKDLEAVQPILNRLDKIEAWERTVKEETFTGDDITIENALALPARSLITEINAIQDLHGQPFPYVGGAYKNKVKTPSATAFTARGITLTTADNGETTLNGTSTAGSIDGDTFELPAGTYTISVGTTLPSGIWISLDGVSGAMISPTGKSISFTTTEAISTFTHIYVNAGVAFNNFKLNWMLEEGSTATSFAPYSNICPISGRDSVVVTRSDGDEISEDFTIQLGTTVYGGTLNVTTGALTVTHKYKDITKNDISDNGTTGGLIELYVNGTSDKANGPTNMLCNPLTVGSTAAAYVIRGRATSANVTFCLPIDVTPDFEAVKTWVDNNHIQLVYALANPTTIQLTPTTLEMLKGYNHVTLSDGYGTIELKALTGANWS